MVPLPRRSVLRTIGWLMAPCLTGCLGESDRNGDREGATDAGADDAGSTRATLAGIPSIESPAFEDGDAIPTRYTCDGADVSPELTIADVPADAASLALLVDDPDAPGGTYTHWILWDVPPTASTIPAAVPAVERVDSLDGARQGTNDAGEVGYSGPCPPQDDGPHTYRFRLFGLAERLGIEAGADRARFDDARGDIAAAEGVLVGTYDR